VRTRRRRLSVAWALLLAGCMPRPPAYLPDAPLVDKVDIDGTKALREGEVKKKIVTTSSSWLPVWFPFLGDAQWFDENAWQADLRRIERLYQSRGYYQARVVEEEVKVTRPGHVAVRARVSEGKPAHLVKFSVGGLDELPPEHKQEVLRKFPLKEGDVFTEEHWEAGKKQITDRLRQLGYADARVTGEVIVDTGVPSADALLEAQTGKRFKFGKVLVAQEPKARVPASTISDEVAAVIHEGDWYTDTALVDAQQRIFSLGVFGAVKVNRGALDQKDATVPIVVDVREAPFQTVRFGGGLGIDALRNEVHLTAEYQNRNFFGGLRKFTVRGKLGYAFLPNIVEVASSSPSSKHGVIGRVVFEFEQPRFFHRTLNLQTSLDFNRGLEPAYSYLGFTYKLGVAWKPFKYLQITPSYNLDLYGLSSEIQLGTTAPEQFYGCPTTCIISYFQLDTVFDWRDSQLEPKNGVYAGLSIAGGGKFIGGAFDFFRITPELRGYISFFGDKVTIAAKVKLGTLISPDANTPIITRYFSGGGNAMRGFSARRLSPHYAVPFNGIEPITQDGELFQPADVVPVGGQGLWEGSLEARWNVWGDLVVAAFGDNGFVTQGPFQFGDGNYFAGNMYWAVGGGLRYRTPIGPIRLDFAYRLPIGKPLDVIVPDREKDPSLPNMVYQGQGGCFGIGRQQAGDVYAGAPEGSCSIHLSVGEAF
jgi:translocation and assembly module TamA